MPPDFSTCYLTHHLSRYPGLPMINRTVLGLSIITVCACSSVFAQNTASIAQPALSLDLAYQAANATLASCIANGFPNATVAVADINGVLLVVLRSPAAPEPTIESARRKAYTSAKTGMSTAEFAKSKGWTDPNPLPSAATAPAFRDAVPPANAGAQNPFANLPVFDNDPALVPWGGGLTIKANGKIVGGIGLSGAPGGQKDEDCVSEGLAKIKDKLK